MITKTTENKDQSDYLKAVNEAIVCIINHGAEAMAIEILEKSLVEKDELAGGMPF